MQPLDSQNNSQQHVRGIAWEFFFLHLNRQKTKDIAAPLWQAQFCARLLIALMVYLIKILQQVGCKFWYIFVWAADTPLRPYEETPQCTAVTLYLQPLIQKAHNQGQRHLSTNSGTTLTSKYCRNFYFEVIMLSCYVFIFCLR